MEKAIRASRKADIVIANHALVLTQAAFDGARTARGKKADVESASLKRVVFDEGHHLFDAADSAFSACLSGQETAELRRWIRGPEGRRRGRGSTSAWATSCRKTRPPTPALTSVIHAAAALPGEGWSGRISPLPDMDGYDIAPTPHGPVEAFLAALLAQLRARADPKTDGGMECAARPTIDPVKAAAVGAARALQAVEAPLLALSRALEDLLDDEADELATGDRARIEGALRGLRSSRADAAARLARHAAGPAGRGGRRALCGLVRGGVRTRSRRRRRLSPPLGRPYRAAGGGGCCAPRTACW